MRKLSVILLLSIPLTSFGAPKIGDYIEEVCEVAHRTLISTRKIVLIDQANNKITVEHILSYWPSGEIVDSSNLDRKLDEYLTLESKIKNIDVFCKNDVPTGSKIKKIKTRAGEFRTCFVGDDSSGEYLANVPLFITKWNNLYFSCEISKFVKQHNSEKTVENYTRE